MTELTPRQKHILVVLALIVAATRFLAVARSLFDWDEALFSLGVNEYDVSQHHPHPPGYPLFIAAAKLVHLLGVSEFRSLQVIVLAGSFFLFPALFALAREIGFDFATSACGATLFAFLPNVWIYGGTAFSDVPAAALGFGACAFLLRGRRDSRAYVIGAVLLGAAAGIRPPNLLIGAIPALWATWHRVRARAVGAVIVAVLLGGATVIGCYLGAAEASYSIEAYIDAVRAQSKYVKEVDSWRNPGRPPLADVAKTFFLFPVQQKAQMTGLAVLALFSLIGAVVGRRLAPVITLAIFGPVAVLAWLNLDLEAASRYAISYMAVHALLAADGVGVIVRRNPRAQAVLAVVIVSVFAVWSWPALRTQRTTDAPPAAALGWIRRNVPSTSTVYVHGAFGPHQAFLLPDHKVTFFDSDEKLSLLPAEGWVVDARVVNGAMNFVRPRNALWKILRRRNFEASISRLASVIRFGDGWYQEEREGERTFRWMSAEAKAGLPAFRGSGRLSIRLYVPIDSMQPPTIEIFLNGNLLERFVGSEASIQRSWDVLSRASGMNELRITTSATVNPSRLGKSTDSRELGLRVDSLSWTPLR